LRVRGLEFRVHGVEFRVYLVAQAPVVLGPQQVHLFRGYVYFSMSVLKNTGSISALTHAGGVLTTYFGGYVTCQSGRVPGP